MSERTGLVDEASGGGESEERRPESDAGSGILRVFGRQLKRFRVRAGMERPDFGSLTGYSVSTIAAYEQGRRVPPPRFIDQADEVLDAGGVLQEHEGGGGSGTVSGVLSGCGSVGGGGG